MSMFSVRYGGKKGPVLRLAESNAHLVVRTCSRAPLAFGRAFGTTSLREDSRDALAPFESISRYSEAGVEVLRLRDGKRSRSLRDRARKILKKDRALEFAGRVLVAPKSGRHYVYTENFFVQFDPELSATACKKLLADFGLTVKRPLGYARNAYFAEAPAKTGFKVFAIAEKLLLHPKVELCHPELIRDRRVRRAFDDQWHLKKTKVGGNVVDAHASVEAAWTLSQGEGTIIAVIDDGVDIDHEEFAGSAKIVAPRDVTRDTDNPRPRGMHDNHGTACAGVACANGNFGASGVAPKARLMPIRLASDLGSQDEAEAFVWAADHGADVISCSWGPTDGDFENASDPLHAHVEPLPDSTRLAIEYAVTNGRGGRGCVVLFAAGNGGESVDNDGYASYAKVIAVAACNDHGKKAPYSDHGAAVFCAFPSNQYYPSLTPGIWTTDRTGGLGYNPGVPDRGDAAGKYTNDFGGTSSACPGAAGVAALVLSRNPELRWDQVRDILGRSADKIDVTGGAYNAHGRSPLYGHGRLNARRAVELAAPKTETAPKLVLSAVQNRPVKDFKKATLTITAPETPAIVSLTVGVVLEHTWVGDLRVRLRPPSALGIAPIVLHDHEGGGVVNLKRAYDLASTPELAACIGRKATGKWTLEVSDDAARDEGVLRSFTLELVT
jgi:subtilisin family serine protease